MQSKANFRLNTETGEGEKSKQGLCTPTDICYTTGLRKILFVVIASRSNAPTVCGNFT